MSYKVDNIIPFTLVLSPTGLSFADFSSAFVFADINSDAPIDEYFLADTYRDYSSLEELSADFAVDSEVYRIATRWFANIPKPPTITVWAWDSYIDTAVQVANKAELVAWRFWFFFDFDTINVTSNAIALAAFADSNEHGLPITISSDEAIDVGDDTDLGSVLLALGNRFVFVGYKTPASISSDPTQAYAMVQAAASFHKFRPNGQRTAITAEYQVLPGIIGDDLSTTAYNALKAKNIAFFTNIELKGAIDPSSRVINTKSMSSYNEFMDDVVNIAVFKNHLQVDGNNYITGAGSKRGLTTRGYSGLLNAFDTTAKRFYDNGVLGESFYTNSETGDQEFAKYGYVINAKPEDVLELTPTEKADRQYPETKILGILARAGHTAAVTLEVE